jgi:DNA-binding response OmpR family regulator
MKILLGVSDEDNAQRLYRGLHLAGINSHMSWDLKEIVHLANGAMYSAVVLDTGIMHSVQLGAAIVKLIRRDEWQIPIILLLDPSEKSSKTLAWRYRCDHICNRYIDVSELAEIIRVSNDRKPPVRRELPRLGDLELDPQTCTVRRGSVLWEGLPERSFRLLQYVVENAHCRITPEMLENDVLKRHFNGNTREIEECITEVEQCLRRLGVSVIHRVDSLHIKLETAVGLRELESRSAAELSYTLAKPDDDEIIDTQFRKHQELQLPGNNDAPSVGMLRQRFLSDSSSQLEAALESSVDKLSN